MGFRAIVLAQIVRAAAVMLPVFCAAIGIARAQMTAQTNAETLVERANRGRVELITGGSDGASIQMAQDIAGVIGDGEARRLTFTVGNGSVQNLVDLKVLRGVDLAIVQSDILEYARKNKIVPSIETVTYVAKLHNQELHLLARGEIRRIDDLAGKKVVFSEGAGLTGPVILDALHLRVERVIDEPAAALTKLKSGEVVAFAYIAAQPTPLYDGLGDGDGFHFLEVPLAPELSTAYVPAQLTAEHYPRLVAAGSSVSTLAVNMVLVAANLIPSTERHRNVADFVDAFFTRFSRLQEAPHHPKWAEVNFAAELAGWKRFPEAELWLKRNVVAQTPPAGVDDLRQIFAKVVDERTRVSGSPALSTQEKEKLFEQFRQWQVKNFMGDAASGTEIAGTSTRPAADQRQAALAPPPTGRPAQSQAPERVPLPGGTILEMVPVQGGTFLMGSNEDASERPIHRVTIAPFSIARYPITVSQWKACTAAGACPDIAAGDENAPVTNVSWDDAQRFIVWLREGTKEDFRLPSEAEWEYAARAGTHTKYWWGNEIARGMADCRGCGEPHDPRYPLKVGTFPANPFGLHDMTGTVAEWVADCWHKNYVGAPDANSPWSGDQCQQHVLRGGSWQNDPSYLRTSSRDSYDSSVRYVTHGFRVARSE